MMIVAGSSHKGCPGRLTPQPSPLNGHHEKKSGRDETRPPTTSLYNNKNATFFNYSDAPFDI